MDRDNLIQFLNLSTEQRLRAVCKGTYARELKSYLGTAAFQEYIEIAERTLETLNPRHLSGTVAPNLIFIPGVMGSLLYSETYGGVWWIDPRTRAHIDDLRLGVDGIQDAHPDYKIKPFTIDMVYEPFLAAALRTQNLRHVVFPYDWRKSLAHSAPALRDQIIQLNREGGQPIHLVAHSMGGLLARATLMMYGADLWDKVGRIVFIGTPHYGSPAIASYLQNHLWGFDLLELLGGFYLSRSTFRSFWGVLTMLPAPRGTYPDTRKAEESATESGSDDEQKYSHPCANFDMYNASKWQLDLGTITGPLGLEPQAQLQRILDSAKQLHEQLYATHRRLAYDNRSRIAVIAGVGMKTLYRLEHKKGFLGAWGEIEKITQSVSGDPHREGDGRIPVASATLEGVGTVRFVRGLHSELPVIPSVYDDVFRWLNDEDMNLPETMEEALSLHLGPGTVVEAPQLTSFSHRGNMADVNLWSPGHLSDDELAILDGRLTLGQLPEFIKTRLL